MSTRQEDLLARIQNRRQLLERVRERRSALTKKPPEARRELDVGPVAPRVEAADASGRPQLASSAQPRVSVTETIANTTKAVARGLSEVGHRAAIGLASFQEGRERPRVRRSVEDYEEGAPLTEPSRAAANLRASRELSRDVYGESEGALPKTAEVLTQMAGEGALFLVPGAGAARATRVLERAGEANRFLRLLASPQGFRQRAAQNLVAGAPIDLAISQAGKEDSLAGAAAALTGSETLERIAENPRTRGAFDVAAGAGMGTALGEVMEAVARRRARLKPQEAVESTSPPRPTEEPIEVSDPTQAPAGAARGGVSRRDFIRRAAGTIAATRAEGALPSLERIAADAVAPEDPLMAGARAAAEFEGPAQRSPADIAREVARSKAAVAAARATLRQRAPGIVARDAARSVARNVARVAERRQVLDKAARGPWRERVVEPASSGRKQRTVFPGDESKVETEFAVVEADELRASHTPDFTQRPPEEFPPQIQGRAYHGTRGRQAREHTESIVSGFDPDRAFDPTVSAADGPPVVTRQGINVAGNGRTIAQQRLWQNAERGEELIRKPLIERAEEFGIDPEVVRGLRKPVLVRRIIDESVDPSDVEVLRRLNQASDVPTGKAKDVLSDAASRAEQFRSASGAIRHFAETAAEDATIRSYLGTADGREFMKRLVDDGVISKSERARFIDATTGTPTDEGKQLIERMFYAAAIGDADVVARAPDGILRKLDTGLPGMIRASSIEGWDIGPQIRDALDLLASARAQDMPLDDLVAQVDLTRPAPDPKVVAMARFLESSPKSRIRDAFRAYADDAEAFARQSESDDLFGFEPKDADASGERFAALEPRGGADEAFERAFGQSTGTPNERSVSMEAGGALSAAARSEPPFSQPRSGPRQLSTQERSPLPTTRSSAPPSTEGGEMIFSSLVMDPASRMNVTQPVRDVKELRARAEATLRPYRRALQEVSQEVPGVHFVGARVKDEGRLLEKIGSGRPPETNSDYLGGRLMIDTIEDADRALAALKRRGWKAPPWGTAADESFFDAPKGGYRARHVMLVSPDQRLSVELQLVPREIAEVQEELHRLYDVVRGSIEASQAEIEAAARRMEEGFGEAWRRFEERVGRVTPPPERALPSPEQVRSQVRAIQEGRFHPLAPPRDLFGEIIEGTERQGELLPGGPRGLSESLEEARATVSALEGKVARGAASPAERTRLEEARALLRREEGRGLDAGEVQRTLEGQERKFVDPENRELFDELSVKTSERLPAAGRFAEGGTATAVQSPVKIVEELNDAIGKALGGLKLAERKIRGPRAKTALGGLESYRHSLRLRDISDVATFGHEAGHAMQKLLIAPKGRITDKVLESALPGAVRGELEDLAKGISDGSLKEGWAEAWRRYLDNPEALSREAPNAMRFIEERLEPFPEVREAWKLAREDWQTFRESSAQARIDAKISVGDREPEVLSLADRWSRFRTSVLDDFEPIRRVVDHIREKAGIETLADDAETLARLTRGSVGVGNHFLEHGALDFKTLRRVGPALKEIIEPVKSQLDDFRRYMVARRAQELHERNVTTGFRPQDVDAAVKQLEEKFGESFKPAFDQMQEWNRALLAYLRDSGVIGGHTYKAITEANQSYVPFYRVHEGGTAGGGLGQTFGHLFSPVKRIKGSGRDLVDPLESMVKNAMLYTQIAQRQQVSIALARLAEKEGVAELLEQMGSPIRPVKFRVGEVEEKLGELFPGMDEVFDEIRAEAKKDFAELTKDMDPSEVRQAGLRPYDPAEELLAVFRPGDYFGKPNTISVLMDGQRRWYEVDPELYASLQGLERESLDAFARWLGAPARTLRAGATLAPEFLIRNPLRDQVMAFVQSEYGYVPFVDMARGAFELVRKGEAYQQWISAGGYRAALASLDRDSMQNGLRAMLDEGGIQNVVKHPLDALRALSAVMEDATRMGEFLNARKVHGTSKEGLQRAASASREISIDFARHGAKTTFLRHVSAFWNARLQGYDRLARAARRNPGRFAAKAFSIITVPSLLEYYFNLDDPDYWEQPQWKRDLFWMVRVGDNWLSIPKPFELGLIFGTLPVRVIDSFIGGPGGAEEIRSFFEETLLREAEGMVPSPTAVMPLIENTVNYSFFLRRPIVPRSEEEVRDRLQGGTGTSEVAKMLARWSPGEEGVSPRTIDNLLYAWTGGLGRLGTEVAGGALGLGEADRPSRRVSELPGVRGIMDPPPGFASESIERFYKEYERARVATSTLRYLERIDDTDAYQRELNDPEASELRGREASLRRAASQLAELRAAADAIRRDPEMSADQKREELEQLGRDASQVARDALGRELPGSR